MSKLAIVLVRGTVNMHPDVRKTLDLFYLRKKFACVVIPNNDVNKGMIAKIKDYVTYGEIDENTYEALLMSRGKSVDNKSLDEKKVKEVVEKFFKKDIKIREIKDLGVKPFFNLHPPIKGFERGGIKKPFTNGGALGYRAEAINDLLIRMSK